MPRHKLARNVAIRPWLSAKLDAREWRFVQLGNSLLLSKRYQKLSASTRLLYLALAMESGGQKTVAFPHGAAKKYGFPSSTFDRAIAELKKRGFILLLEDEERGQFKANVFQFSEMWKSDPAPQNGEGQS